MNEIFILCNSPQCLKAISSGAFPDLDTKDIFTCNFSYTFFRTSGKHFNFMTDEAPIRTFYENDFLRNKYFSGYKKYFLFSKFHDGKKDMSALFPDLWYSSIDCGCSSAFGALFLVNRVFTDYEIVYLVGHTFNEWNLDTMPKDKAAELQSVYDNFTKEDLLNNVFKFTRKKK